MNSFLRLGARQTAPSLRPLSFLRFSSSAASLSPSQKAKAQNGAQLSHLDPPAGSQTSAMISHHQPFMVATYARPPVVFTKGQGCHLWDIEGRRYIDFNSGIAVNALGHNDKHLVDLLYDQASQLIHVSNLYYNPWTGELSRLLVERTTELGGFLNASKSFVCNSGSEANEAAIKFARKVGKTVGGEEKYGIVSFSNAFHGRTMGSLSATPTKKYQNPFAPMLPGFKTGEFNDVSGLESLVTEETAGVIVEPIQGEGGVNIGKEEFLVALRKRCNGVGAVLIYDEIQSGMGRTGQLWAHQALPKEAQPDVLTVAKALGNGFPIGATIVNEFVAGMIVTGDHGTTFGGNPLACRVGHYVFDRIANASFLAEVERKGAVLKKGLETLKQRWPRDIVDVRGRGLILGAQLKEGRDPAKVVKAARERGLLVITAGGNTLRFLPPLIIEEALLEEGLGLLEAAMEECFGR